MARTFLLTIFTIPSILIHLFLAMPSSASCNLTNTLISLQVTNKPTIEILKSIEKQTEYTINIQKSNEINTKKSILFDQTPLNQTLSRLLKNQNYSITCNDEQKTLTIVFFEKGVPQITSYNPKLSANTKTDNMNNATSAFQEYRLNKSNQTVPEIKIQKTSMSAVNHAFQEFKHNKNSSSLPYAQSQKSPMNAANEAFQEFKYNKSSQSIPELQIQQSSMMEVNYAFQEKEKYQNSLSMPEIAQLESSMDSVTAAFKEYSRKQQ